MEKKKESPITPLTAVSDGLQATRLSSVPPSPCKCSIDAMLVCMPLKRVWLLLPTEEVGLFVGK